MLQSLLFLNALCFGVGMPLVCQDNTQEIQDKVEFKQDNRKFVSYNDESYSITLTADELNNYVFENLYDYLHDLFVNHNSMTIEDIVTSFTYDSVSYNYDYGGGTAFVYVSDDYTISFNHNPDTGVNTDDYKFYLMNDSSQFVSFDNQLVFTTNEGDYDEFKHVIELDIQANDTQPHLQPVLTELVSLLTAGITALASGIGQGVSTLVSDIFINNGGLSTFGAVICIFGGIALAIGLSRWVMNFLTSLGAKK